MWLPILGLLLGIFIGAAAGLSVPVEYARYVGMAILAGIDAVIGGIRANMETHFDSRVFLSGFIGNVALAALLTYLADRLGVELYMAAIVAFGVRIFNNLAVIRRRWLFHERG
ncbi:MAG: small basic family protein [Chloroflexi bacterium]|nr:small basic family protein [Chloroflexota bacterium]